MKSTVQRRAELALALLLLTAALTFYDVWPTPAIQWYGHLSVEVAGAVLLVALLARRGPIASWLLGLLSAGWVALFVGRYFDVMAPALYGRPVNLYWDARHLSAVAAMMTDAVAGPLLAALLAGVGVLLGLAYLAARWAFRTIAAAMAAPLVRRRLTAGALAVVALYAVQVVRGESLPLLVVAPPVVDTYWQQARLVAAQAAANESRPLPPQPDLAAALTQVRGADVVLVFVESYGAVTLDRPAIAGPLVASRARFAADAVASGRQVVSAMVDSPTFGGSSWLAHVSLMTGVEARDEATNQALMSRARDTLVSTFGRAGYRTVALMPGLRFAWPEGAFYGFDRIYDTTALGYTGPEFGWWSVPDQFALARLDELEAAHTPRQPLFVFFPTTNTHIPFGPVAPYQPDWPRLTTAAPYADSDVTQALAREPDYLDLAPSYVHAVSYTLETLGGYLRRHAARDLVLVVVGDHQPAAAVSGADASWDVPVHVVTQRAEVLDALVRRGFHGGVEPGRKAIGPMHALLPALLASFSDPAVRAAAAGVDPPAPAATAAP
jgi:hypothetical protein